MSDAFNALGKWPVAKFENAVRPTAKMATACTAISLLFMMKMRRGGMGDHADRCSDPNEIDTVADDLARRNCVDLFTSYQPLEGRDGRAAKLNAVVVRGVKGTALGCHVATVGDLRYIAPASMFAFSRDGGGYEQCDAGFLCDCGSHYLKEAKPSRDQMDYVHLDERKI